MAVSMTAGSTEESTMVTTVQCVKVNHVGVSVRDLASARRFWIEGLGASEHGAFAWPVGTAPADESLATRDTAAEVVLLRTDSAFMELFAFSSPAPGPRDGDAPGVCALDWAVPDVDSAVARAVECGGTQEEAPDGTPVVRCPEGTPVRLVPAAGGVTGLVGIQVRVPVPEVFPFSDVAGPVELDVVPGGRGTRPRAVDLGINHVCLDVTDAQAHRDRGEELGASGVTWHHPVTESSGGAAAVCYGTTHDGVLVELFESRTDEAFFARSRLSHG